MSITATEFAYIRKLVYDLSAITLEDGKEWMIESRLLPVARRLGFSSLNQLIHRLQCSRVGGEHQAAVDAMTTNETFFFRDVHPFTALQKQVIPDLLKRRASQRKLTIWCAASSTGQEPYSIAMLLQEHFPQLASWQLEFLATDINAEVLQRARDARYTELEVRRGLPAPYLNKYFTRHGADWVVQDRIRHLVEFRQMNLAGFWPVLPPMDLIFIRNVLIYFGLETKREIFRRLAKALRPDGYLFLGGAESTLNVDDSFRRVQLDKAVSYQLIGRTESVASQPPYALSQTIAPHFIPIPRPALPAFCHPAAACAA